jgi:hypothetical protein
MLSQNWEVIKPWRLNIKCWSPHFWPILRSMYLFLQTRQNKCHQCPVMSMWLSVRASPPCRVKGSWQALWRGLGEKLSRHSCQGSSNLSGLFKLPAPLTILPGERCSCCAHIPGPHPLAIQWIVPLLRIRSTFGNIPDNFPALKNYYAR